MTRKAARRRRVCVVEVAIIALLLIGILIGVIIKANSGKKQNVADNSASTEDQSQDDSQTESMTESESESETETTQPPVVEIPEHKVVYLTFDDGPGKDTERLLDILDKYNVKVTFFVTNQNPAYVNMIGEEARRGHTVAIHTYTHEFSQVYASVDAYLADFNKMNEVVKEQTGSYATLFRFPGGASNTKSKSYCKGIMTELTKLMVDKGYDYYDWNVSSGDAGETKVTQEVYQNVIDGISKHDTSVILQHDIHSYSVDAVEDIIKWGLENGYTFLPLTKDSKPCKHGVNN